MISRSTILILAAIAFIATLSEAFAPAVSFNRATTSLEACRTNSKKEKRVRNRENMRKFAKKRGPSRKRLMKKIQSTAQRERENEFVAKLFVATETADESQ